MNIIFYVAGMPFNGDTLKTASLGGSETAGLCMAREMAARGHDVVMFCNTEKPGKYDGVTYRPAQDFLTYASHTPVDVCVVQRIPQVFSARLNTKLNILWMHDLALKRQRGAFKGSLWNVDQVCGVSDYHVEQMSEVYGVPKDAFAVTRNGIDPIQLDTSIKRLPKRLIYTARPERGMDLLLREIMPRVWKEDPEVELVLAGYDNTVPEMQSFYDSLHQMVERHRQDGRTIWWLGPLTKEKLYKEYQQATMYVYPTDFEEVSCITAMECMATGLPVVTTGKAALDETLDPDASLQFDYNIRTEEGQDKFADAVLSLMNSPETLKRMSEAGPKSPHVLYWKDHAAEWEARFTALIEARSANKDALARQFYRTEDIMALRHLKAGKRWSSRIAAEYPFIDRPEEYAKTYRDGGAHYQERVEAEGGMDLVRSPRFQVVIQSIDPKTNNILDYGGGYGNEAVQFVNRFGCRVTTVNIIPAEQELGKKYLLKHCTKPEMITWQVGEKPEEVAGVYDTVFAGELLEHLWAPWEMVDELEKRCLPGGQMIFTVPHGSWGDTDAELKHRGHLWNFDRTDLKEMFGQKKDLSIKLIGAGTNPKNLETLSWFVITYKYEPGVATGRVDLDRKIRVQAPRQTLSTCMIIGGAQEDMLHRALKSVYDVSDQIVVCDTGMSGESRRIIDQYRDKITYVPSVAPPRESGFDAARNESIKHAWGDWILWLDCDEVLLYPKKLYKYLRISSINGFSIRQHHFSAHPPEAFKPDTPVRLFRNHRGTKFYGMVHEHPEDGLNQGVTPVSILADVEIAHDGYLTESIRRGRFNRNYPLMVKDREKYPDRVLGRFLMMRDQMHLVNYIIEENGGVTAEAIDLCMQVLNCYRDHFLGKNNQLACDGLRYYSEALTVLNKGLDVTYSIKVNDRQRDVAGRFLNKDDFMSFLASDVGAQCEEYEGRYV